MMLYVYVYPQGRACAHTHTHTNQYFTAVFVTTIRVRLQCRSESKKVMSKGVFEQAVVVRGRDWMWKNQDGQFLFILLISN